jgi:hypothetical protein
MTRLAVKAALRRPVDRPDEYGIPAGCPLERPAFAVYYLPPTVTERPGLNTHPCDECEYAVNDRATSPGRLLVVCVNPARPTGPRLTRDVPLDAHGHPVQRRRRPGATSWWRSQSEPAPIEALAPLLNGGPR